jgi:hypothetical protein
MERLAVDMDGVLAMCTNNFSVMMKKILAKEDR